MNEGTIFTFYSYKGGVGRTFALANIGALLSLWGYKTLCVDWDLEAPGLHLYFQQWINGKERRGLIEMIQDHADGKKPHWRDYVTKVNVPDAKQPLLLMTAGLQDTSYVQRMQELNWANLYENFNLGSFLEEMREDWKESLDFVLIDSRTGITDIGGICTVQFPDVLVLLFTANNQSLYGSIDVVERARRARAHLPVDRAKVLVLPIVARFEGRVEVELATSWLKIFEKELAPFYIEWSHRDSTIPDLLNFTRIPYVPYWSFGEKLPVIEKGTRDPDDIGFPLETLTALVAQQLSYSDVLVRNRDTFVTLAKKEPIGGVLNKEKEDRITPNQPVRAFISYTHRDEDLRRELEKHLSSLKRQGWLTDWYDASIEPGANWRNEISHNLEEAEIILLLISPDYLASDFLYSIEMMHALARHDTGQATIIPIILRPTFWENSPIGKLQVLPIDGRAIMSSGWYSIDEAMTDVVLGIRKAIEGLHTQPQHLTSSHTWNIPYARNPLFTGREDILERLYQLLKATRTAALVGLGGIGKTQTVVEYAYRYRDHYQAILWVKAETEVSIISDFVTIAQMLDLQEKQEQEQHRIVEAVKGWFQEHPGWLLIFDNADDLAMVREFLPTGSKGHILLTTRAYATGRIAQHIEVEKMEPEEGALFLLHRAMLLEPDAPLEVASSTDQDIAKEIVRVMDGLPLALDQAGAYTEETGCGLQGYLQLYRTQGVHLLQERGEFVTDYPEPVATTWSLSFQNVEQANPAAAELLRFCAFLASDAIPEELFTQSAAELGPILEPVAANQYRLNAAIRELLKYSLVQRDAQTNTLSIHRLVQRVLKDQMNKEAQRKWAERTVKAVNHVFPNPEYTNWDICRRYFFHAQVCIAIIYQWELLFSEAATLLNNVGFYLWQRGEYEQVESLHQRALAIREQVQGPDHSDTATSLSHLAFFSMQQGKYEEAEPLYQRALAIYEKAYGSDHPGVAIVLNNLAELYRRQGKYKEAEPLYQRALAIKERVWGSDHPSTAISLSALAELYRDQGKYEEAEPLLQGALMTQERVLGPEHPDTAATLDNLALLYRDQGKYEEAEPLYQRALMIYEEVLGPAHPDTASILNNLALLYEEEGKYEQAEPLYLRALAIRERMLGPEHPDTVKVRENYTDLFQKMKKRTQATDPQD